MLRTIVALWLILGVAHAESSSHHPNSHKSSKPKTAQHQSAQVDLTIIGPTNMADGLGRQSAELINELGNDFTITFIPSRSYDLRTIRSLPQRAQDAFARSKIMLPGKIVLFEDAITTSPSDQLNPSWSLTRFGLKHTDPHQIRFAYSMFESTRICKAWVEILNKQFDAVIVPDSFLVPVYKSSGVTIPIFVVPLGLDLQDFLNAPLKNSKNTPFVFANFGQCSARKNQLTIVRAFAKAFGDSPKVKLQLGWRFVIGSAYRNLIVNEIARLGLHNIEVQERCLNRNDYVKRFCKIDCCINLSKGEGFSIQPRESMALGIPVIVSNSTAQKTICESGLVRSVPANVLVPADYGCFRGIFGQFEDCTVEDAAVAMQDMYNEYETYLKKAQDTRKWARQYHYPNLRSSYKTIVSPKSVKLGNRDTIENGKIISTCPKFVEKCKKVLSMDP